MRKIYVVYFLGLLLVISYVCEKLFGCHIQLVHEDVLLQRQPPIVHQYCQHESMVSTDLKITLVQLLPLRLISRLWGYINQIPLPYYFRKPLFHWYSATFGCNLDELDAEDLTQYRNLSEFFRRSLKPNARVIDQSNGIVSFKILFSASSEFSYLISYRQALRTVLLFNVNPWGPMATWETSRESTIRLPIFSAQM